MILQKIKKKKNKNWGGTQDQQDYVLRKTRKKQASLLPLLSPRSKQNKEPSG